MNEVTDEMLNIVQGYAQDEAEYGDSDAIVRRIIELHEQGKPKPEPFGYLMIVNGFVIGFYAEKLSDAFIPVYAHPPTREPYTGERIICAAIMNESFGIFCGYRHNDCIKQTGKYHWRTHDDELWQQGFITTDNGRFVDRAEAWIIADKAGQIINRGEGIDGLLFSENLY
jgi:hypothetical protein